VEKRMREQNTLNTKDFEYFVNEQHEYGDLAETYGQAVNDHYCELCRHLILAATVLIGLSGTIGVAPALSEQLEGSFARGALFTSLSFLLLSLLSGAAYLWKSAQHLLSYMTTYEDISDKACQLAEGLATRASPEAAMKEYSDFCDERTKNLTVEAGRWLLKGQIAAFLVGALAVAIAYAVTVGAH
jgi:hypothetical protein